ncbi:class 1 isoprenoid biosynthesis enzyme [Bacillus velezensis]|uniref:class 1 isoprenoid biosynthesis enzyme n=1 Tax=Bacillus velezensis TaxID=492670 RepID=UPI002DBD42D4|nr:class 1 isoprenoid biosynthesis enzyme [Bacillus velezensis]MEC0405811.1 class 1 isoprenoid biosynthesis enzyme [Bacillus velezensis]
MKTIIEQMCLDADQIKNRMKSIIEQNIFNEHLLQLLLGFVESRKYLTFAESALFHYDVFGGKDFKTAEKLAAGIEILTLSADIIDDLEDEDNNQALWMKIDRSEALSAAFSLYTAGLQGINSINMNPLILTYILKYTQDAMQGQHDDIINKPEKEDESLEVIRLKCGSLFALSNVAGTMLATGKFSETVETYSYYKGMFEQIYSDYLALFSSKRSDILKDKHTLINLYLKRLFNEPSEKLVRMFSHRETHLKFISDKNIFIQTLTDAGVTQYVSVLHQLYKQKCENAIERLNLENSKIDKLEKYVVNRGIEV